MTPADRPLHVLVAGGGFAAAEAALALRAHAGDRVDIELVAPNRLLPFRPGATLVPFGDAGDVARYDLGHLCDAIGARFRRDSVAAVASQRHEVRLKSGGRASYDALVLALGAAARVGVQGAVTFRDQRDFAQVAGVVAALRDGRLRSLAFAAPAGVSWTLPLYELALQAAADADRAGVACDVRVVTPERAPLEVFGPSAAAAVADLLADADVRFVRGAHPRTVDREGLVLSFGGRVPAERVIAVPSLVGRRIAGVPGDFGGFVRVDAATGRVEDVQDVWAAGDMTSFPVKQGGIAAQQADLAAVDIAARAGAPVRTAPSPRLMLRAHLVGGARPLFLRSELDAMGLPVEELTRVQSDEAWPAGTKVFGRHLAPWMAGDPAALSP